MSCWADDPDRAAEAAEDADDVVLTQIELNSGHGIRHASLVLTQIELNSGHGIRHAPLVLTQVEPRVLLRLMRLKM